jgi:hypothetical protein
MSRPRLPLSLALALLVAGALVLATAAPATAGDRSAPLRSFQTADDALAAINDMMPGFGGMFVDEDGTPTVWVTPDRSGLYRKAFGPGIRVLDGRWEFRELLRWRAELRVLLNAPGVVLLDADEAMNRVRVGVTPDTSNATRRMIEARLRGLGVPGGAVVFEETEPIHPMVTLSDPFSPVPGGVEIHWSNFLCTLGFNIRRGDEDACFFVTNDHCTDVQGTVTGTIYMQPVFGPQIGVEVFDPPFFTGAPCPAGRICRYSDAAVARYFDPNNCEFGKIARTLGIGSTTIDPANPRWTIVAKVGSPSVGHLVAKTGRTTGWTENGVAATCVDTNVFMSNITRLCQSFVFAGVGGGDSGSPVFLRRLDPSIAALGGILWGSNGTGTQFVFSPVENIEKDFGFALIVF